MYQLCGTILGSVTSKKYLGVYLNHNLEWDHNFDQVTAKAARKLGFIRRNLRGAPAECKKLAYIALVWSGMEYASIIWDLHTITNSDKLEKIQRSAARWVLSSYSHTTSVTSLLEQLKLEPLQTRRRIQRLAFMYKILNGQVAVPMADLDLKFTKRPIRGEDINTKRLETLISSTDEHKFSFTTWTIKEWNAISQSVCRISWLCSNSQGSAKQTSYIAHSTNKPLVWCPSLGPCRLTARSRSRSRPDLHADAGREAHQKICQFLIAETCSIFLIKFAKYLMLKSCWLWFVILKINQAEDRVTLPDLLHRHSSVQFSSVCALLWSQGLISERESST